MKKALMFLILSISVILFSAQFEIVKDVIELQNDLTAAKYGHKDVNGDWCAILKVHTDVKDLQFEGLGYEKHDYWSESGIYLVYLQPDTKNLRFIKDEFIAYNHTFPFKLKGNAVYQIDIKGVGEEKKIENIIITIQTIPSGGEIYFDGKNFGFVEQIESEVGPHEIKIKRSGYEDKTTNIHVSAKNNFFKIELVPLPGTIQLNTVKPEVDYTKSGMFFSLETGLYIGSPIDSDSLDFKFPSTTFGFGFGFNSNIKISEWLDALIRMEFYRKQDEAGEPTLASFDLIDTIVEKSVFGSISGGIKLKFSKRVYISCEAGLSWVNLTGVIYEYEGSGGYSSKNFGYDSWDFNYIYGLGYEYKRLDMFLKVSSYVTDYDTIRKAGLSLGYKFWMF